MNRENSRAIRVGILVFTSITLLMVFIYFMGSKDNLFRSKINISTSFNNVQGVVVGNNVRFSGLNIGKVTQIELTTDSTVMLQLAIVNEYAKFIYNDAIAEIGQDGLVGNKLIVISSGNASSGIIKNGSHLQSKESLDIVNMLFDLSDILNQSKSAMTYLNSIAAKIDKGEGDIGHLLNNKQISNQIDAIADEVNNTLLQMNQIAGKINKGDGDIAKLINTNELSDQLNQSFEKIDELSLKAGYLISELEKTTQTINEGEGAVQLLLNDRKTAQNIDSTIIMLQKSLGEFDSTAKAIRESWVLNAFSRNKNKNNNIK